MRLYQIQFFSIFVLCLLLCGCNSKTNQETKTNTSATKKETTPALKKSAINWISLPAMEAAMEKEPKDILVMVYATWCEESKRYEETTYQHNSIIKYINDNYYAVKVDAEEAKTLTYRGKEYNIHPNTGHNEIVYELKARSIPCLVFLDENFELQGHKMGYTNMEDLDELLFTYNN